MAVDPLVHIFPQLKELDITSLDTKISVISQTFFFFLALFVVAYIGSCLFVDTFNRKLRSKEKVFWCLSFVRGLFGFTGSFCGLWYLFEERALQDDIVNANNVSSFLALYIAIGFFIFECVALFGSNIYFRKFDAFLFIHHSLSLVGSSIMAYYDGKGHFFAVVGLLLEGTTPFSCFCWMLLKCNMAHLAIWKLNQLILIHLFHCRTTLEGYLLLKSYYQWENITEGMPLAICIMLYTQLTLQFFVLTPYWTYKKMMQLFNPVDWNHPDLSSLKLVADSSLNGTLSACTAVSDSNTMTNSSSSVASHGHKVLSNEVSVPFSVHGLSPGPAADDVLAASGQSVARSRHRRRRRK